tara:strand:- start:48 stop:512 length:465 start_codon:yes stop_codon:yes gene_type:complete
MVITTDFNIFADKYHNKQHLPDDMISMIMNINTKEIQTQKDHQKVINEINDIFVWNGDGDDSIEEKCSDESNIEYEWDNVFIHPTYYRVFQAMNGLNIKVKQETLDKSEYFEDLFWTSTKGLNTLRFDDPNNYIDEYKRLYPENFVRDWDTGYK